MTFIDLAERQRLVAFLIDIAPHFTAPNSRENRSCDDIALRQKCHDDVLKAALMLRLDVEPGIEHDLPALYDRNRALVPASGFKKAVSDDDMHEVALFAVWLAGVGNGEESASIATRMKGKKWSVFRLADDRATYGENAGKLIITTADGAHEITGVVFDERHAEMIALAPEMVDLIAEFLAVHPCGEHPCTDDNCEATKARALLLRVPKPLRAPDVDLWPQSIDDLIATTSTIEALDPAPSPTIEAPR